MFHCNKICCFISLIRAGFDPYWKTTQMCKLICEMRELRGTIAPVSSPMEYYMILHGNDHKRSAALLCYTKSRTSLAGWMPGKGCA